MFEPTTQLLATADGSRSDLAKQSQSETFLEKAYTVLQGASLPLLIKRSCLVTNHIQPCFADKDKAFQENKTCTKRKAEAKIKTPYEVQILGFIIPWEQQKHYFRCKKQEKRKEKTPKFYLSKSDFQKISPSNPFYLSSSINHGIINNYM